ncbi:MAG: calcium-binding protein, partial [Leptolyngbya sp. SIO3F4]|nr:calcium-binding protein [Leptolyngbya sp. SIO3F4]
MVQFNFISDPSVTLDQRLGFEMAAGIWSQFITDDVTIKLQLVSTDGLDEDRAIGGAVPIFHEIHYGVYQDYLAADATSAEDDAVLTALQDGNTVDFLVDTDGDASTGSELVDGNTKILLTRAQAKALGMEESLILKNGSTWDRDVLTDPNAIDGYILINNSYSWNYDLTRSEKAPPNTLDFLTMALHEIGHQLGFVSGLDGLIETFELYSGELRTEGFTALDLMRYSETSANVENPDGSVSDLSVGSAAYFSLDGGATSVAEFEEGDQYQASHWQRFRDAIGIMDPSLRYRERTDISHLDLQAFDVLGWDINYEAFAKGLDLNALYGEALQAISADFGVGTTVLETAITNGQDWHALGQGTWWQVFKDQMIGLGYGSWWQQFEADLLNQGYTNWWQIFDIGSGNWWQIFDVGAGNWWQIFEETVLDLGHHSWWQQFETNMLNQGYSGWWQVFEPQLLEASFSGWWQLFEKQMVDLGYGSWWQQFEADLLNQGYSSWWQVFEVDILSQGYGSWWQIFEETVLDLGYSGWWQIFESSLLNQGWGTWYQKFESNLLDQGWGTWYQKLDTFFATLDNLEEGNTHFTQVINQGFASIGQVRGGANDDILSGSHEQDRIRGGDGDDLIDGHAGNDLIWGDAGRDIIYGHDGYDALWGGADDDLLIGERNADQLYGEQGHDALSGGHGNDILSGGIGRDDLTGGDHNDILQGGDDDDVLYGGNDYDLLMGASGRDRIQGETGDDILYGDEVLAETQAELNKLRRDFLRNIWRQARDLRAENAETVVQNNITPHVTTVATTPA